MNSVNNEVNYLVHLLACALNEKPCDEYADKINYDNLFDLAKKHQIYNMIYPLIENNPEITAEQKAQWHKIKMMETAKMVAVNNERKEIYALLSQNKIKHMPLKGLILKNYYPKESMRQMSDNDIMYDPKKRETLFEIMKKRGFKTVATGENSDDFVKPPYCTFEFHRDLFFNEKDFCPNFNYVWANASVDGEDKYMYHMSSEDNYIYSVCHMYKHYSTAGCGIRFLADIYLILKKEGNVLNRDYIDLKLTEFGILDYEKKSRELALKLFDERPLDNDDIALLETYINFGIYGSGKIKLEKDLKKLSTSENFKSAKRKYIWKRIFPSAKKMKADYIVLQKKPWLLPAYYIYRLFKALINKKETVAELKNINEIEEK